jgi:hypothetical protein
MDTCLSVHIKIWTYVSDLKRVLRFTLWTLRQMVVQLEEREVLIKLAVLFAVLVRAACVSFPLCALLFHTPPHHTHTQIYIYINIYIYIYICWIITNLADPWPRGLRRKYAAVWLLGSRVRILLGAWMFVSCVYMLCYSVYVEASATGGPLFQESYRASNCVWLRNLKREAKAKLNGPWSQRYSSPDIISQGEWGGRGMWHA